ncbi:PRD domain-containing protein [Vibrio ruber]|uniref:BglG family transcription antiterminator n=1 Tax=Vibrio ruber TaxID=184755 RepID=UPI0028934687|nr:PRD domain-containing protein [Vibrio ruber]WNJ97221.1 PRD domain-containing protein [Vibrio ruber]
MNQKLSEILTLLREDSYLSAKNIANRVNTSEKTVRNRIKLLNEELHTHGATILSKPNMGFILIIHNEIIFSQYKRSFSSDITHPKTPDERVIFLLSFLISRKAYIKMDDICDNIFVSRNTLSTDIKKVESILNRYQLNINRRPNYGIIIEGEEIHKRMCISEKIISSNFNVLEFNSSHKSINIIHKFVVATLISKYITISDSYLDDLVTHIFISLERFKNGFHIMNINNHESEENAELLLAAHEISDCINREFDIHLPEKEIQYLSLLLSAKLPSSSYKRNSNLVISRQIDDLTSKMFKEILDSHNLNFFQNFDLRLSISKHLVPFDLRMRYGIPVTNPLKLEIIKELPFAFALASTASLALSIHYGHKISDDEITYFAMLIELALDKNRKGLVKKNIVIVCSSGKSTSQLIIRKYRNAFGDYIDNIFECSSYELSEFNFEDNHIDYVFSTVKIDIDIPVPIVEVSHFLESKEIDLYTDMFEKDSIVTTFYRRELFFNNIDEKCKEDVIKRLCQLASEHIQIPEKFLDSVSKREELGQTDFGNLVATPHPYKIISDQDFVIVGVLKEPIWWGKNDVQIVLLMSVSSKENEALETFYERTSRFVFNEDAVKNLIIDPSFDNFISLL